MPFLFARVDRPFLHMLRSTELFKLADPNSAPMIHRYALLIFLFIQASLHAQDLQPSDVVPIVGDTFRILSVDNDQAVIPAPGGVGQFWDHSDININTQASLFYERIDPLTAPEINVYPLAENVVRVMLNDDPTYIIHDYYFVTGSGIEEIASHGPVLTYENDDPELWRAAPISLGDTIEDTFCFTSNGLGVSYHFCGEKWITLDGEGTLILPFGSHPNTIRTRSFTWTVEDGSPADTSYTITYSWWVEGVRWPVLHYNRYIPFSGSESVTVTIMENIPTVGIAEHELLGSTVRPTVFTDVVSIDLEEPLKTAATLHVISLDGRLLHSSTIPGGSIRQQIDLSSMPPGSLVMTLECEGLIATHRLVHLRE